MDHPLFDWYLKRFLNKNIDVDDEIKDRLVFIKNKYRNHCVHNLSWDKDTAYRAFHDAISYFDILVADIEDKRQKIASPTPVVQL